VRVQGVDDKLVAERGTPRIAPIRVPAQYDMYVQDVEGTGAQLQVHGDRRPVA
jgi:hypothetical protein